jgi:hypothetical protein
MLPAGRSRVSISDEVIGFSQFTLSFQPHSASNRNEYRESSRGGEGRPARKTDKLTAICEPILYKMWEPRRLTTLWASTACCRNSVTFLTLPYQLPAFGYVCYCRGRAPSSCTEGCRHPPAVVSRTIDIKFRVGLGIKCSYPSFPFSLAPIGSLLRPLIHVGCFDSG